MADTNLTRTYTIPLRKRFVDVPRYKRAKRAVKTVREFLERHMKSEDVRIGPKLNEKLWVHGIKNPPARVKVTAFRNAEGVVRAELEGYEYVDFKVKEKTDKNASIQDKLKQKVQGAKSESSSDDSSSSKGTSSLEKKASSSESSGKTVVDSGKTTSETSKKEASSAKKTAGDAASSSTTKKTASKKTVSKKTPTRKTTTASDSSSTSVGSAKKSSSDKKE